MNLLDAEVGDGTARAIAGRFDFSLDDAATARLADASGQVTLGIRAEDIRIGPGEAIEAVAHGVENHGVEKIVTLRVNDCLLASNHSGSLSDCDRGPGAILICSGTAARIRP